MNRDLQAFRKFLIVPFVENPVNTPNRLKFLELANIELKRSKRQKSDFSILMLDIDHFKSINDTYGHNIGDEVLKEISKIVSNRVRETDTFARWGGEEFVCLLPNTSLENARIVAESIRKIIEYHHFHKAGHLTVSIGVSKNYDRDSDIDKIIEKADKALYKSKNSGRNKVTLYFE